MLINKLIIRVGCGSAGGEKTKAAGWVHHFLFSPFPRPPTRRQALRLANSNYAVKAHAAAFYECH